MSAGVTTPKSLRVRCRIYCGKKIALGPGKADLLDLIQKTGSISNAARSMSMSYNHAWELVQEMNACFREPLVVALRGGAQGGGAALTETGRRALSLYRQIETESLDAARQPWTAIRSLLR